MPRIHHDEPPTERAPVRHDRRTPHLEQEIGAAPPGPVPPHVGPELDGQHRPGARLLGPGHPPHGRGARPVPDPARVAGGAVEREREAAVAFVHPKRDPHPERDADRSALAAGRGADRDRPGHAARPGRPGRQRTHLARRDPRVDALAEPQLHLVAPPPRDDGTGPHRKEPVIAGAGPRATDDDGVGRSRRVAQLHHDGQRIQQAHLERPAYAGRVAAPDRLEHGSVPGLSGGGRGEHRARVADPHSPEHACIAVRSRLGPEIHGVTVEGANSRRDFVGPGVRRQREHGAVGEPQAHLGPLDRAGSEREILSAREPHPSPRPERGRVDPDRAVGRSEPRRAARHVDQLGGIARRAGDEPELHDGIGRQRQPREPGAVGPDPHREAVDGEVGVARAGGAEEEAGVAGVHDGVRRRVNHREPQRPADHRHRRQMARGGGGGGGRSAGRAGTGGEAKDSGGGPARAAGDHGLQGTQSRPLTPRARLTHFPPISRLPRPNASPARPV